MSTRKTLLSVHSTHHLLTQTKQELLLQLQQIEPDLRTAGLEIDLEVKLGYKPDDKRQERLDILRLLIGVGVGRIRPRLVLRLGQCVERWANENYHNIDE
jgi:hypothetical protein